MRPRLLSGRPCADPWDLRNSPALGQHSVSDLCHQKLGSVLRVGGQAKSGQGGRLQHDPLHSIAGEQTNFLV